MKKFSRLKKACHWYLFLFYSILLSSLSHNFLYLDRNIKLIILKYFQNERTIREHPWDEWDFNILTKAEEVLEEWKTVQPDYDRLVTYYDSEQWRKDYFDSNDGKIPDEVPQWVLTQDAIFDVIGTQFYLADEFQTLLKTIKDKEWKE